MRNVLGKRLGRLFKPGGHDRDCNPALSTAYFVLIREMRDAYNHRLRLVESAAVAATARPLAQMEVQYLKTSKNGPASVRIGLKVSQRAPSCFMG
jgi:hypothetical protein